MNKIINQSAEHLRKNKLCSHAQFLRALEIVMRNQAKSVKEQMEIFNEVPEDPV